jgi:hypothetical protein
MAVAVLYGPKIPVFRTYTLTTPYAIKDIIEIAIGGIYKFKILLLTTAIFPDASLRELLGNLAPLECLHFMTANY